ncbi:MAG: nickel-dependent lactate racemase [Promethearchaeota archaeon]
MAEKKNTDDKPNYLKNVNFEKSFKLPFGKDNLDIKIKLLNYGKIFKKLEDNESDKILNYINALSQIDNVLRRNFIKELRINRDDIEYIKKYVKDNKKKYGTEKGDAEGLDYKAEIEKLLIKSFDNPYGTPPLREIIMDYSKLYLSSRRKNVLIVINDQTRSFPFELILPPLTRYIESIIKDSATPDRKIEFLMATGLHDPPTEKDLELMFGSFYNRLKDHYKLFINSDHHSEFVYLGETSFNTPVEINKIYVESGIRIILSQITPHLFAGFGGGRKSILAGIGSKNSIMANHKFALYDDALPGKLEGNPIHEDLLEAAYMAKPEFVINIISNPMTNNITRIFSGDLNKSFLKGVEFYKKHYTIKMSRHGKADVLVVSPGGDPEDLFYINVLKTLRFTERCLKKNADIYIVSECSKDIGTNLFSNYRKKYKNHFEIIQKHRNHYKEHLGYLFYHYLFMEKYKLHIITKMDKKVVSEVLGIEKIDVNELEKRINSLYMNNKNIYFIPYGSKTLIL